MDALAACCYRFVCEKPSKKKKKLSKKKDKIKGASLAEELEVMKRLRTPEPQIKIILKNLNDTLQDKNTEPEITSEEPSLAKKELNNQIEDLMHSIQDESETPSRLSKPMETSENNEIQNEASIDELIEKMESKFVHVEEEVSINTYESKEIVREETENKNENQEIIKAEQIIHALEPESNRKELNENSQKEDKLES